MPEHGRQWLQPMLGRYVAWALLLTHVTSLSPTLRFSFFAAGADANLACPGNGGGAPLHLAVSCGYEGCRPLFDALLAHKGTDVNARDKSGFSPCHVALSLCASSSHSQQAACGMAVALVQSGGLNLGLPAPTGRQLLTRAVGLGIAQVVGALLDRGANCNQADAGCLAPLLMAAAAMRSSWQSDEGGSGLCDRAATLLRLVQHPAADVDAQGPDDGNTVLHTLLSLPLFDAGSLELVHKLLQRRPDLCVRNRALDSPLHLVFKALCTSAPALGGPLVVAMVQLSAAAVAVPDAQGNTAMHLAVDCDDQVRCSHWAGVQHVQWGWPAVRQTEY